MIFFADDFEDRLASGLRHVAELNCFELCSLGRATAMQAACHGSASFRYIGVNTSFVSNISVIESITVVSAFSSKLFLLDFLSIGDYAAKLRFLKDAVKLSAAIVSVRAGSKFEIKSYELAAN